MSEDMINCVETLISRAADETDSQDAMRFSQAACNAANALAVLTTSGVYRDAKNP